MGKGMETTVTILVSAAPPINPSMSFAVTPSQAGTNIPFACGFVFKKGDIPSGFLASIASGQVTPKNRYPDGSLKFAVLAGRIPIGIDDAPHTVMINRVTSAPSGNPLTLANLQNSGITASLAFVNTSGAVSGAVNLHDIWLQPSCLYEQHISGPVMSSWTFFSPIGGSVDHHVWFEVRYFGGQTAEILCWLENGYARSKPVTIEGRYRLTVQGTIRYDSDAANAHCYFLNGVAVPQPAGTPFRLCHRSAPVLANGLWFSHLTDGSPPVWTRQDLQYLRDTKLVPNYSTPRTAVWYENHKEWPQSVIPNYCWTMGSDNFGPRGQYGIVSEMQIGHLTRGTEKDYRQACYFGIMNGSYSIRLRDATTKRPIKPTAHPTIFWSELTRPAGPHGSYQGVHAGATGWIPYLITGWNWFCEEQQMESMLTYAGLSYLDAFLSFDNGRSREKGIIQGAVRARAWGLKRHAAAAVVSPDPDLAGSVASGEMQAEIINLLGYNFEWAYKATVSGENFGGVFVNNLGHPIPEYTHSSWGGYVDAVLTGPNSLIGYYEYYGTSWWTNYMAMVHGFIWDLDLNLSAERTTWLRGARDHFYKYACQSANGWWWRYINTYSAPYGKSTPTPDPPDIEHWSNWSLGYFIHPDGPVKFPGSSWHSDYGAVWKNFATDLGKHPTRAANHNFGALATERAKPGSSAKGLRQLIQNATSLSGGQWLQTYGPEIIPSIAYAKDHGAIGAGLIWTYLEACPSVQEAYTNQGAAGWNLSTIQRWSIQPRDGSLVDGVL